MASGSSADPDRLARITRGGSYADHVTFEPGGQLELALPPAPSAQVLLAQLRADIKAVRADCLAGGVLLQQAPVDPRAHVPLRLASPRYLAMQRHFDSISPAGRTMMRRTASTQVCLDWWPGRGRAGAVAACCNLSAPFLAAAFARSTGPTSRLATWLDVDPDRTSFDDRLLGDDPVASYAAFAAGAPVFTTPGDVDEHLTTLFPAVRPRRTYLEVRYLDVQPIDSLRDILAVLTALMYDATCRASALAMLEPEQADLARHWAAAAAGCPVTTAIGREVVALALGAARAEMAGVA